MVVNNVARLCRRLPWFEWDAATRLASAEVMLDAAADGGPPAMRWYVTVPPALYLGASQKIDAVDVAACRAAGIAVYQRAAGGTAVLADEGMLGLDVVLPRHDPLWLGDLTQSYRWLGEVWTDALRSLGVAVDLIGLDEARAAARADDEETRLARAACFGGLSPYEVVYGQRKVVGLAQMRRRGGALFVPAVLLHFDAARLADLLAEPAAGRAAAAAAFAAHAAGLDEIAPRPISCRQVIAAVEEGLAGRGFVLQDSDWTAAEQERIEALKTARYRPLVPR